MNAVRALFAIRPRRQLRELYWFTVLFSLASSLITVFEPVFLFREGFSLAVIAVYYALHYLMYVVLMPLGGKFAARFGLERSLGLAMPLFVVYFLTLAALPGFPGLFWIAWVLLTFFKIFYWPAYHADAALFGDRANRGTEISWMYALIDGVGVFGPLLGGAVVTIFGFPVLFVLAAALALLAALPLLRTRERYRAVTFPYVSPWRVVAAPEHRRMSWAMVGWGENLIDLVYWPIFLFIMVGGAGRLGLVVSLNTLLMVLLGFFVGEVGDRVPRRRVLRLYLPFFTLSYLFRPLAGAPLSALLTDSLAKASYIGVRIPFMHQLYLRGKRSGALRYMVAQEMVLAMTKTIVALLLAAVFVLLPPYQGLVVAFVLAAVMTAFYLFL